MDNILAILDDKLILLCVIMLCLSCFARLFIIRTYKATEKVMTINKITGGEMANELLKCWNLESVRVDMSDSPYGGKFFTQNNEILLSSNVYKSSSIWANAMVCKEFMKAYYFNKKMLFYIFRDVVYSFFSKATFFGVFMIITFLIWGFRWMLTIGLGTFIVLFIFNTMMLICDLLFNAKVNEVFCKQKILDLDEVKKMQQILFSQDLIPICVTFDAPGIIVKKVLFKFSTSLKGVK